MAQGQICKQNRICQKLRVQAEQKAILDKRTKSQQGVINKKAQDSKLTLQVKQHPTNRLILKGVWFAKSNVEASLVEVT